MSYKNLYILIIAVLFLSSCSKDAPTRNTNNTPTGGDIVVNINGYAWAAPVGYISKGSTAVLTLSGQADQSNYISITVSPYNGINTYPFNGITKITYFENNTEYQTISGQVVISSEDDYHIAGTFNGELLSNAGGASLLFTNGQFYIDK